MKIFILNNKICDIGIKYLGLGLFKLIKLNNITLYLKYFIYDSFLYVIIFNKISKNLIF